MNERHHFRQYSFPCIEPQKQEPVLILLYQLETNLRLIAINRAIGLSHLISVSVRLVMREKMISVSSVVLITTSKMLRLISVRPVQIIATQMDNQLRNNATVELVIAQMGIISNNATNRLKNHKSNWAR